MIHPAYLHTAVLVSHQIRNIAVISRGKRVETDLRGSTISLTVEVTVKQGQTPPGHDLPRPKTASGAGHLKIYHVASFGIVLKSTSSTFA